MATFDKVLLSGSTGGRPILVAATSSPGTTIHTTGISAATIDEVWLYASNTDTTDRKLTIQFGDTTSPNDLIELTIKAENGLVLIAPGLPLVGTGAAGRVVRAFAAAGNLVNIIGYVNRITP